MKTFLVVFIILVLIFLLQAVWTFISELAGKDLDAVLVGKFLLYLIPNLIPMVLPLTILVASIMTFGDFAENYEFAAMKSSGISLQRAMRSLILFITFLSITTFFFANDVIPWSRFKSINLRRNIAKLQPAMSIAEGEFNQLEDYNIKVAKKSGKDGEDLEDVIIHIKGNRDRELTVIKAKTGKLKGDEESDILSLILFEGTLYQRQYPDKLKDRSRRPFIKNGFEEYKFNIDMSGFNDVDFDDEQYNNASSMLNISELRVALDSLSDRFNQDKVNFSQNIMFRNGTENLLAIKNDTAAQKKTHQPDSLKKEIDSIKSKQLSEKQIVTIEDSIPSIHTLEEFYDSYGLHYRTQMTNLALTTTEGTLRTIKGKRQNFRKKQERLNVHEIELHKKYAMALMCYVLFFVGAPLGAIIRKGGIGMPMVVAIILFLVYHYIGMFAENSAKNGSLSPFVATWISSIIMLPLSIIFTYQATTDKSLFNPEVVMGPIRKFFAKIGFKKGKKKNKR